MRSCEFNIDLVLPRMRSMRINGISTCFRLEEIYWIILKRISSENGISVSKLVSLWARHVDLNYGQLKNLSSFLRVACVVYLVQQSSDCWALPLFDRK